LGKLRTKLEGHSGYVNCLAFTTDGKTLASGGTDQGIRLWDVPAGKLRNKLEQAGKVPCLAFSPDGKTLASGSLYGLIDLWDVQAGTKTGQRYAGGEHSPSIGCLAFSPDGRTLAWACHEVVGLWRVRSAKQVILKTLTGECMMFGPDGKTLLVSFPERFDRSGALPVEDSGTAVTVLLDQRFAAAAFSRDGKTLTLVDRFGCIEVCTHQRKEPITENQPKQESPPRKKK
jgi:WD40 repeat protein